MKFKACSIASVCYDEDYEDHNLVLDRVNHSHSNSSFRNQQSWCGETSRMGRHENQGGGAEIMGMKSYEEERKEEIAEAQRAATLERMASEF